MNSGKLGGRFCLLPRADTYYYSSTADQEARRCYFGDSWARPSQPQFSIRICERRSELARPMRLQFSWEGPLVALSGASGE